MCGKGEGETVKGNRKTALKKKRNVVGNKGLFMTDLHWSLLLMTPVWW